MRALSVKITNIFHICTFLCFAMLHNFVLSAEAQINPEDPSDVDCGEVRQEQTVGPIVPVIDPDTGEQELENGVPIFQQTTTVCTITPTPVTIIDPTTGQEVIECQDQSECTDSTERIAGCFAPETKIVMADQAVKPAYRIVVGDQLWNPVTKQAMEVTQVVVGEERLPLIEIGYADSTIRVTEGHAMIIKSRKAELTQNSVASFTPASLVAPSKQIASYQVKKAIELNANDFVLGADGSFHQITVLKTLPLKQGQLVYNFKVKSLGSLNPNDHMILTAAGIVTGDLTIQEQIESK